MPGEYFEARERALLGTRYDVLYAASCAVRRGVTVNGLRCAPQEFAAAVDFGLEPSPFCDAAFLLTDPQLRPGRHAYHHAGVFYSQEPSASSAAPLLGVQPGMRVLDMCAAPGGKTILLAEQMHSTGRLYSCDAAENRVGLIRTAVQRMGLTNVEALCNDATKVNPALPQADRILADVPCSGLGILAKKPDLRYKKLEPAREAELLATQSAILDTAAQLLKAGGRLVYSTCTIDPAENQQQIAAFLARHPEFTVVEPAAALPAGMTAGEHGALSVPTRTGMDGFFLCAMQKNGEKLQ